jgi:hypothetical protein
MDRLAEVPGEPGRSGPASVHSKRLRPAQPPTARSVSDRVLRRADQAVAEVDANQGRNARRSNENDRPNK